MGNTIAWRRRSARSGFTLIELLVVIAIIAILAAILFPVFASAKQAGQKASCVSNFKQVYTAVMGYSGDWNNRLPPAAAGNLEAAFNIGLDSQGNYIKTWPWLCSGYMKTYKIVRCPADRSDPAPPIYATSDDPEHSYYDWINWGRFTTPGLNYVYLSPVTEGSGDTNWISHPISVGQAVSPSKTVMLAESHHPAYGQQDGYAYGVFIIEAPTGESLAPGFGSLRGWSSIPNGFLWARHLNSGNAGVGAVPVVWLDGHVTITSIEKLSDDSLWDLN